MLRSRRRLVWLVIGMASLSAVGMSGVALAAGRAATDAAPIAAQRQAGVGGSSIRALSLSPTGDCTIASAAAKTAECRSPSGIDFAGNSGATLYRTLLDFSKLRAALPAGARVLSARLSLSVIGVDGSPAIAAYALTKPFVQKQVSWEDASQGHPWLAAGGDAPSMARSHGFAGFTKPTKRGTYDIPVTALVRSWLDGATPNDGLLLRSYTESRLAYDAFSSYSGEQSPLLEINWVPATPSAS